MNKRGQVAIVLGAIIIVGLAAGILAWEFWPDENELDVPWSFITMHVEDFNMYDKYANDVIALMNKYHAKVTWVLHPQMVRHILEDPAKVAKIHEWQAEGHEFGIHAQGCVGEDGLCAAAPGSCLGPNDAADFEKLLGKGNVKTVVGGGSPNNDNECIAGNYVSSECTQYLPDSVKYFGRGRWDGRSAMALIVKDKTGKEFYGTAVVSGYTAEAIERDKNQYNSLGPDDAFNFNMHTEWDNLGLLEDWLKFLSAKDPEGLKRSTQSWITENVFIKEDRAIDIDKIANPENYPSLSDEFVKCAALVGDKITSDGYWYSMTDLYNFGRCLNTGTYCLLDQPCVLDSGNPDNFYIPQGCTSKSINDLNGFKTASETCKVVCGDGRCDRGEENYNNCPVGCPADCGGSSDTRTDTRTTTSGRCKDISGVICSRGQTCSGKTKIASDTDTCCVGGICS